MQMIPLLPVQEEVRMPGINQIIVNREFLGLGKELEEKRRERRLVDAQSKSLENHVQSLERQHKKTIKEINRKQKLMEEMLALRQRQDEERQFRDRMAILRDQQQNERHRKAIEEREAHLKNKQQAFSQIRETNRNSFIQGRLNRRARQHMKAVDRKADLNEKQERVDQIESMKHAGRLNVIKFKQDRNKEFIDEYKRRMDYENQRKSWKAEFMNNLESREKELVQKLQQSSRVHDQLKASFEKKNEMNLRELESVLMGGTLETKTSRASSRYSKTELRRSLLQGRSRERLDIEEYKRNKSVFSTTMELVLGKNKLENGQVSTKEVDATLASRDVTQPAKEKQTMDTALDKKPGGIEELIANNADQEEEYREKNIEKRHKRKRNLHANRYKDYEIF